MSAVAERADAVLRQLAPTTLEELTADAELMTRTDRKYLVPVVSLGRLVARIADLDPHARVLEIDARRQHGYASTYLDTAGLESYRMAAQRRRRRFKVRSRTYADTGTRFLEVKVRGARGTTVKTRAALQPAWPDDRPPPLTWQQHDFVAAELARAGHAEVDVAGLRPVLDTTYQRATLWLPSRDSRVTLDTGLAWSLPRSEQRLTLPAVAVVETKTAGGATGIDRVLWSEGHRPARFSKYATGLSSLVSDLAGHRWHRTRARLRPDAH